VTTQQTDRQQAARVSIESIRARARDELGDLDDLYDDDYGEVGRLNNDGVRA